MVHTRAGQCRQACWLAESRRGLAAFAYRKARENRHEAVVRALRDAIEQPAAKSQRRGGWCGQPRGRACGWQLLQVQHVSGSMQLRAACRLPAAPLTGPRRR